MVENVAFDDGDFVQTYQLNGGAYVQLLRYGEYEHVPSADLVAGDWPGATNVQGWIGKVGGCTASGVLMKLRRRTTRRPSRVAGSGVGGSRRAGVSGGLSAEAGHGSDRRALHHMVDSMDVLGGALCRRTSAENQGVKAV